MAGFVEEGLHRFGKELEADIEWEQEFLELSNHVRTWSTAFWPLEVGCTVSSLWSTPEPLQAYPGSRAEAACLQILATLPEGPYRDERLEEFKQLVKRVSRCGPSPIHRDRQM